MWTNKLSYNNKKYIIQHMQGVYNLVHSGSPNEKVYDYIMNKIISKEWSPGTKIMTENQLAVELEVSRISVREALEKLVAFGLLVKKQGSGTIVSEVKPATLLQSLVPIMTLGESDLATILEFRILFEPANVHLLIQHYDQNIVDQLKETYEQMKMHYEDPSKFYLFDYDFHDLLAKGTKNAMVITISEILTSILKFNIKQMYYDVGPDNAMYYHQAIIEAIEKKDAELAALFMKRHLEEALKKLKDAEQKQL